MESTDQLMDLTSIEPDKLDQSHALLDNCDVLPGGYQLADSNLVDTMFQDLDQNNTARTFEELLGELDSQHSDWRTDSPKPDLHISLQSAFPDNTTHYNDGSNFNTSLSNSPSIRNMDLGQPNPIHPNGSKPPPKIGTRFSREAISVLRRWLASHSGHPYPSDEEKELLHRQTGLSKTQIANWLANARRRTGARSMSSSRRPPSSGPIDIPQRPGTPAVNAGARYLNPMERWFDSPPENEPATVTAIARAIASDSSCTAGAQGLGLVDNSSDRSLSDLFHESSGGNSYTSGSSLSSAYSHESRESSRASSVLGRRKSRRPTRVRKRQLKVRNSLVAPHNRYQCTFCTETFRTKYDWQRHEKSLHIPLERWACAPGGPLIVDQSTGQTSHCAFCGEVDPTGPHIQSHNPLSCQERTFSRKDHLKQHLRLVHNTALVETLTKHWKVPTPEIRSRCGFCGISMDTWSFRVDHLADHFKMGQTMADWKGDWGFDEAVLNTLENAIPPYVIDDERNTPAPFMASQAPIEAPRNAYELLKSELTWFLQMPNQNPAGSAPVSEVMQHEACRIIFAAEVMMLREVPPDPTETVPCSWLRDLITAREDIAEKARFGPLRTHAESALSVPKLLGNAYLFEECPLEAQLGDFVRSRWVLNQTELGDAELQAEAQKIIARIDREPTFPRDDTVAKWLLTLVGSSTEWLTGFRARTYGALVGSPAHAPSQATKDLSLQSLSNCLNCLTKNSEPPQRSLLSHAATGGVGHGSNGEEMANTTRSVTQWAAPVARRPFRGTPLRLDNNLNPLIESLDPPAETTPDVVAPIPHRASEASAPASCANCSLKQTRASDHDHRPPWVKTCLYFFNDSNFYRWLARDLGRWVVATMSPNNPNRHVPSDEELRHQARCILYDDDDPWNPTAADNAEWLRRFKEEYGVVNTPDALQAP